MRVRSAVIPRRNMHSRTMSFAVERTLSSGMAGMRFVEAGE